MSQAVLKRILRPSLHKLVTNAHEAVKYFSHGMNIGWSGFTPVNYPKAVPIALAEHVEKNNLQGKLKFNIFCGASTGLETEDRWAKNDMISGRWPYITGKHIAQNINNGTLDMGDAHVSNFAQYLAYGFYTMDRPLDIGIIEVAEIAPDGGLLLGGAVGSVPEIVQKAEKLIIEVNPNIPKMVGMHDIVMSEIPPRRQPFLISRVDDRIGTKYVPCDPDKIIAIVESPYEDKGFPLSTPDQASIKIAENILDFFEMEVKAGRLPKNLLPMQSGAGNIANAIVAGLLNCKFDDLLVWTEVLQDNFLDFFDSGKLTFASACSLSLSVPGAKRFYENLDKYRDKIVLRPQSITNQPEIIRRLGIIAMNTPVEVDIYGHGNSSLVNGSKMIHGLGGSNDFFRNAYISIAHTVSARPTKTDSTGISCIVPKCSHVDHTEHDIAVIVTEQGLADLRGLAPRKRAKEIITKCAHPDYKDMLLDYYKMAEEKCIAAGAGHEPQLLDLAYKMHVNVMKNGTMKVKW